GLSPSDKSVRLQVGDATGQAAYDGANDPVVALTFARTSGPVPISATAYDAGGVPTRGALYDVAAPAAAFDVQVAALPVGGARSFAADPTAPTSNFAVSGVTPVATVFVRWSDATWVALGDSTLA